MRTTNHDRAGWAEEALRAFGRCTGQNIGDEPAEMVADLLTDLIHYCNLNGIDFQRALDSGSDHFDYEINNPEEG